MEKYTDSYFVLTESQAERICEHFGEDYLELEQHEIFNLLDIIIESL